MPQPREPRDFTTPPKSVAALLFASALVLAPSGPVHAVTFDFTRIVQSSDALGGARTFDQSTGAFVSDGNVLFNNIRTSDGRQEFHVSLGGALHFVADDTTTPVPDQIGNFSALLQLDIDGETVAFSANTPSTPTGIYSWTTTDGLQTVVDNTITPPGAAGGFNNATLGGFEDGVVTFLGGSGGNGTANSGIFTRRLSDGVVETVADLSDFPLGFGLVRSGGGDSLFVVTSPDLYTNDGGTFRLVADTNTPIPGGTGNFTAVDVGTGYATDGETIAFQGSGSGQIGIYKDVAGTLSVVVDNTTVVPDGTGGVFASFNQRVPDVGMAPSCSAELNPAAKRASTLTWVGYSNRSSAPATSWTVASWTPPRSSSADSMAAISPSPSTSPTVTAAFTSPAPTSSLNPTSSPCSRSASWGQGSVAGAGVAYTRKQLPRTPTVECRR